MKVVAFNGSPRKQGNTAQLISQVFKPLEAAGFTCEMINIVTEKPIRGCRACLACRKLKNQQCVYKDDQVNDYIQKMIEADAILLASPTYFANMTPEIKALIDRAGYVCRGNGNLLRRKVGAAVVAMRRAGGINVFNSINDFFLINEMLVPGASYWNLGMGGGVGEVTDDQEGLDTMTNLGQNIAWLLSKL